MTMAHMIAMAQYYMIRISQKARTCSSFLDLWSISTNVLLTENRWLHLDLDLDWLKDSRNPMESPHFSREKPADFRQKPPLKLSDVPLAELQGLAGEILDKRGAGKF